jgi:hypothetical protein
MKKNEKIELLHFQRKKWTPHNRNNLCWSFFYVNDNGKVTLDAPQIMHCMLCYSNLVFFLPKNEIKKGFNILLQDKWNNLFEKRC